MQDNHEISRPDLSAWQARHLRLTAFPTPDLTIDLRNWWLQVVGEEPETIAENRKTAENYIEGEYHNNRLRLSHQLMRIDWNYFVGDQQADINEPGFLDSFPEAVNVFHMLMNKWLVNIPGLEANRLAFGADLLQLTKDSEDIHKLLSSYLPFDIERRASDLIYQINRPRQSKSSISGLTVNRLAKWSAIAIQSIQVQIPPTSAMIHSHRTRYACRLELDINTSAGFEGQIDHKVLFEIFDELVELGSEIARKGDIP